MNKLEASLLVGAVALGLVSSAFAQPAPQPYPPPFISGNIVLPSDYMTWTHFNGSGYRLGWNELKAQIGTAFGDVRNFGAKCDAQVEQSPLTVTAGSGGTRTVAITGNFGAADVGKKIVVSLGGVSSTSAFTGIIAAASTNSLTITAAPGTAVSMFTSGTIQWGTDDYIAIAAAISALQGTLPIVIPAQCGTGSTVNLTGNGATLYGLIGPPGHHDGATPYTPPLSSAFVWLGSCGGSTVFQQTSVSGASNLETKGQTVRNLAFFGGNCAAIGRGIATVANSEARGLYSTSMTQYGFSYGINGASSLSEIGGTCYNTEFDFVSDGAITGQIGYFLSGDTGNVWNTCLSEFHNFKAFFSTADAIQIAFADHNLFTDFSAIGAGSATTAYSVHLTSATMSDYAQANGFIGLSVGNLSANTQGHVKIETAALGNWVQALDSYNPPAGWTVDVAAATPFNCTTDKGLFCGASTLSSAQFGTPASSSAACSQGQTMADASYIYTCSATNTWRRAATASF